MKSYEPIIPSVAVIQSYLLRRSLGIRFFGGPVIPPLVLESHVFCWKKGAWRFHHYQHHLWVPELRRCWGRERWDHLHLHLLTTPGWWHRAGVVLLDLLLARPVHCVMHDAYCLRSLWRSARTSNTLISKRDPSCGWALRVTTWHWFNQPLRQSPEWLKKFPANSHGYSQPYPPPNVPPRTKGLISNKLIIRPY